MLKEDILQEFKSQRKDEVNTILSKIHQGSKQMKNA